MPYQNEPFGQGQYYHIYNRGAGKEKIFFNQGNYEYLLRLMKRYSRNHGTTVIAYCLMPNHFHFLLRQETEEPLTKFMSGLFNAYVQALNLQQGREGALFGSRFQHKYVDKWEYLVILCRYIHRNPIKAGMVSKPEDWIYSNYREWIGIRNGELKDGAFIHDHFPNPEEYVAFVNDIEDEKKNYEKISQYMFD